MKTRDKVQPAVAALLQERGYRGLTYEGVAARSGVAKTTLYRHWPTKAEMVFDIVVHNRSLPPLDCEPSISGVARVLARRMVAFMSEGVSGSVIAAVLLDMAADPSLAERLRQGAVASGTAELQKVLESSGLKPLAGYDVVDLHMILLGATQAWLLVSGLPAETVETRVATLAASLLEEVA